jgi:hypothetical protein
MNPGNNATSNYPLVVNCQCAIIKVLPIVMSYHEVSAFYGSICELKGAVETSTSGMPRAFITVGSRQLGCPFLICGIAIENAMEDPNDKKVYELIGRIVVIAIVLFFSAMFVWLSFIKLHL